MALIDPTSIQNRLLTSLPAQALDDLLPHLRQVELPHRHILQRPNEAITSVHFVETGYVSQIAMLENGDGAEVGVIGKEGLAGLPLILGDDRAFAEILVQAEGRALELDADRFLEAIDTNPSVRRIMLRYAMTVFAHVTMTAACNGNHHIDQRIARWLLMAHDRVGKDEFPMTHEFLSMMLGVRRAGVTLAAGALQKGGFITYDRGRVRVTDRPGLEAVSCECYDIVQREYQRLLGSGVAA